MVSVIETKRMTDAKPKHPLTLFREAKNPPQTLEAFASEIGTTKGVVWKWENGTIPRPPQMQKIIEATGGKVGPADWYSGAAA